MRRIVSVDRRSVRLDASIRWLRVYKSAFREDPLTFLFDFAIHLTMITDALLKSGASDQVNLQAVWDESMKSDPLIPKRVLRIFWAMAANAEDYLLPHDQYFEEYDVFSVGDVLEDLTALLSETTFSQVKSTGESVETDPDADPVTIEAVFAAGIRHGLTMADTQLLSMAEWLDFATTCNNRLRESNEPQIKTATQSDFDAFSEI